MEKDRGENHADKASEKVVSSVWSAPTSLSSGVNGTSGSRISRAPFVARRHGASPWKVIPVYICATSIWTYDGNNLEALAARRTCAAAAAGSRPLHGATLGTGDVLRVRATGHRDEYDAVCATLEGVKPQ